MKKIFLGISLLLAMIFQGCEMINPPEDIPAYIHVDSVRYNVNTFNQGTASQKVTDIWVITPTKSLGGYEMPATLPILDKGTAHLYFQAGVKQNGTSITHLPYPFFKAYDTTVVLEDKKIVNIIPVFKYNDQTKFGFIENFEGVKPAFDASPSNSADFSVTHNVDSVFEGTGSLQAVLAGNKSKFEIQTHETFNLPRSKAVWLEINYKTDVPISVGFYAIGSAGIIQKESGGMNPSDHWNKIYIDLTENISLFSTNYVFSIYMGANKGSYADGSKVLIDNVKLLYLE